MMRIPRRSTPPLPLLLPAMVMMLAVTACSDRKADEGNAVDVAAAASRAQSDIANYAAAPERDEVAPAAKPSAPATPTPAASATVAPAPAAATPEAVVRRYVAALAARRYDEAWALWEGDGQASGMTQAAFAASFDRYATYRASVGTPFDADAGAGQRYITVPVTVTGTLRSGAPFRLEGPVILHKAADGIESDDPHAHDWRIRSSEMKPRPTAPPAADR